MTVSALVTDARAYAETILEQATDAMGAADTLVQAIGYTIPNFTPVVLPGTPPSSISLTLPVLDTITLDLPAEPGTAPVFQDISPFELTGEPTLDAVAPTLVLPSAPSQVAEFLEAAPGIDTSIVFPDPPDALMNPLITEPVLPDRAEPIAPTIALPGFDAVKPENDAVAPTNLQDTYLAAYREVAPEVIANLDGYVDAMIAKFNPQFATQMSRIESQLTTYMNGGTGFNAAVEDAIYSRARDKNGAEARRVSDAAWGDAADRGFTLPTGQLLSAVQQARQSAADNNARAASDIVIKQAEIEQANLQFAVTQSVGLRSTILSAALSYHQNLVSINGQALECAKTILNAILENYNTAVKVFSVKLDAYRAEAMVYETRLKAAMAGIELYRVEVSALEAMINVDRAKVDIYRARIDSLGAYANIYRAQIEAVQGRANLERLKLDVYQSKVQAYTALVQAKSAEWQGYSAAIEGQNAKVRIYAAQLQGFTSKMEGYKVGIEAKSEVVRTTAITNQARAANYAAQLQGYSSVIEARGKKASIQLENQRQEIVAFQALTQAQIANVQVQLEYYRAVSSVAIKNAELRMTAQVETGNSTRAFGQTIATLGTSSAQIYGQLANAAMSGMNTLVADTLTE